MPEDRELLTAGESGGGGGMLSTALGDMGDADAELLTGLALRPTLVGDGIGVVAAAGLALEAADPSVAGAAWPAAVLLTFTGSGKVSSEAPAVAFAAVTPLTRGES